MAENQKNDIFFINELSNDPYHPPLIPPPESGDPLIGPRPLISPDPPPPPRRLSPLTTPRDPRILKCQSVSAADEEGRDGFAALRRDGRRRRRLRRQRSLRVDRGPHQHLRGPGERDEEEEEAVQRPASSIYG